MLTSSMASAALANLWPALASFTCALLVLERGADGFVDAAAVLATKLGVSEVLVGLVTAGAEWEELVVIATALIQHRPALALGNIVGSSISNILGAFSLGLLFQKEDFIVFDRSSRIYTLLLLVLTLIVAVPISIDVASIPLRKTIGAGLVVAFIAYLASIAWGIYRGVLDAPEMSDSDSDSDSDSESESNFENETYSPNNENPLGIDTTGSATASSDLVNNRASEQSPSPTQLESHSQFQSRSAPPSSTTPLLVTSHHSPPSTSLRTHLQTHLQIRNTSRRPFPLKTLIKLLINLLLLLLSSYVLTSTSSPIISALGLSDALFGVVVLSIATTLPEKFIAVVSARKGSEKRITGGGGQGGQGEGKGILIANTVGSNVFLLTLGLGVWYLGSEGDEGGDGARKGHEGGETGKVRDGKQWARIFETGVLVVSTLGLAAVVWSCQRPVRKVWARVWGALMLGAYVAFLVLEVVMLRK